MVKHTIQNKLQQRKEILSKSRPCGTFKTKWKRLLIDGGIIAYEPFPKALKRELRVFCRVCARQLRYDAMYRHAHSFHDQYPRYLKKGQTPTDPYYKDWKERVMKPEQSILKFEDGSVSSVEEEGEEEEEEEIETIKYNQDNQNRGTEVQEIDEFDTKRLATKHSKSSVIADHFLSAQDEILSLGSIGTRSAQSEPLATLKMFNIIGKTPFKTQKRKESLKQKKQKQFMKKRQLMAKLKLAKQSLKLQKLTNIQNVKQNLRYKEHLDAEIGANTKMQSRLQRMEQINANYKKEKRLQALRKQLIFEKEKSKTTSLQLEETLKYRDELKEQVAILRAQNQKIKEYYASNTPAYNGPNSKLIKEQEEDLELKDLNERLQQRILFLETANANLIDDKALLREQMRLADDWEPEAKRLRNELEQKESRILFLKNQVEVFRLSQKPQLRQRRPRTAPPSMPGLSWTKEDAANLVFGLTRHRTNNQQQQ